VKEASSPTVWQHFTFLRHLSDFRGSLSSYEELVGMRVKHNLAEEPLRYLERKTGADSFSNFPNQPPAFDLLTSGVVLPLPISIVLINVPRLVRFLLSLIVFLCRIPFLYMQSIAYPTARDVVWGSSSRWP